MIWSSDLILSKWLIAIGCLLLLLASYGGVYYAGKAKGEQAEQAICSAAESATLAQNGEALLAITTQYRDLERQSALKMSALKDDYERKINDEKIVASHMLASVAAGTKLLSIPIKKSMPACSGSAASINTITPSPAGETSAELSQSSAEFLINFARECDATAEKLNAVIDIAKADRAL